MGGEAPDRRSPGNGKESSPPSESTVKAKLRSQGKAGSNLGEGVGGGCLCSLLSLCSQGKAGSNSGEGLEVDVSVKAGSNSGEEGLEVDIFVLSCLFQPTPHVLPLDPANSNAWMSC